MANHFPIPSFVKNLLAFRGHIAEEVRQLIEHGMPPRSLDVGRSMDQDIGLLLALLTGVAAELSEGGEIVAKRLLEAMRSDVSQEFFEVSRDAIGMVSILMLMWPEIQVTLDQQRQA